MKYLQEGIVWEYVNSCLVYTRSATACHGHRVQDPPRLCTSINSLPSMGCPLVTESSEKPSGKIDDPGVRAAKDPVMPIDSVAIGPRFTGASLRVQH